MHKCDICKREIKRKRALVAWTPDDHIPLIACSRRCARRIERAYLHPDAYPAVKP